MARNSTDKTAQVKDLEAQLIVVEAGTCSDLVDAKNVENLRASVDAVSCEQTLVESRDAAGSVGIAGWIFSQCISIDKNV